MKQGALLVPQRAVRDLQGLFEVAVVGADDTVETRPVKVGERIGSLWIVDKGLKPGERVIVEGAEKVRSGEKVKPIAVADRDAEKAPAAVVKDTASPPSAPADRGTPKK